MLRSCDYLSNVPSNERSAVAHSQPNRSVDRSSRGTSSGGLHGDIARNDAIQFKRMEDGCTISPSATKVEDTGVTFVLCVYVRTPPPPPHPPLLPDEAMNN